MADQSYPVQVCLKLLEELAIKHGYKFTGGGLHKLVIDGKIENVKEKYLKNTFYECRNAQKLDPQATKSFRIENIDAIAKSAGYDDMKDFLSKHNLYASSDPFEVKLSNKLLTDFNPKESSEWLDKYMLGARFLPALLGLIPLVIWIYFSALKDTQETPTLYVIGLFICVALAWGLSAWLATLGKKWEKKIFFAEGQKGFPTAYMMLYGATSKYSEDQKIKYRDKLIRYFDIEMPTKLEEQENEALAVQKLNQASYQLKNVVKSVVIRSALIRYGFLRNLIPSAWLAIILSLPALAYAWWHADILLLSILSIYAFAAACYCMFYEDSVRKSSEAYGRYLIDEFMSR
ncbi:hypothetical protein [Fulvivirga sediminis]|uniref:Uncharacterized protein n=1 Tax=Fulvivirga sediminis TaxID=2803949 RepID=A0A937FA06_9BACT|nr:hypothetical protein [Fulvivirga sediminis]MBL3656673.1 hypothetical protein [Fulvivirga sediminis]